jgi:hypothetical protein
MENVPYKKLSSDKYTDFGLLIRRICPIHGILDTQIHVHVPGSNKEIVTKIVC